MATKVLDVDLDHFPEQFGDLGDYPRALVLFRWRGRPVGKALLPVIDGRLNQMELRDTVNRAGNWPLWEQRLHAYLDWSPNRMDKLPTATVAVCTRNRPEDIERCLPALLALPDLGQEYLIVDNAPSSDASKDIIEKYAPRVRYVRETRPGLDIARNRALREARTDVVVFNDDDAVPDAGWLHALLSNFTDPDVLCVTGLTMPLELETPAQEYFEWYSSFSRGFQRRLFYGSRDEARYAGQVGAGANMALRRSVLERVGPFDEALDSGTATKSGGDTEMFARILSAGYHIIYDPAALSWHRHRRTWEELLRVAYGYGVGMHALWTRRLVVDGEWGAAADALRYFLGHQLLQVPRSLLRRPDHLPLDIVMAELQGSIHGPFAYFKARREAHQQSAEVVCAQPLLSP